MGLYVKLEHVLSIGHWMIDAALSNDDIGTREDFRKTYYMSYDSKMLMQALSEQDIIQQSREQTQDE